MYAHIFDTPLGKLCAIGDHQCLHRLCFSNHSPLPLTITAPLASIQKELSDYFEGRLHTFQTPLFTQGTPFQKKVWQQLQRIPYGQRSTYAIQAQSIQNPRAYRAVGTAIGRNPYLIVVPCHRVLASNGSLGGYSAGILRKEWLLEHEGKWLKNSY